MLAPTPHSKGLCGLQQTPVLLTRQTHGLCAVQWRVLHLPAPQHVKAFCRCWMLSCLYSVSVYASQVSILAQLGQQGSIWLHF